MSARAVLQRIYSEERDIHLPARDLFPNVIRNAQNADGGWGYRPGYHSVTEPTAWSLLALQAYELPSGSTISSGVNWLRQAQTEAGAWPTGSGKEPGCWVTALACLALLTQPTPPEDVVARGISWLCDTWPAEGSLLWRFRHRRRQKSDAAVHQNHALRGWGWTPDTASWVEPTAYGLIMLQNAPQKLLPTKAMERMQLGEQMLYDRACAGGGWNAGNPLVYGVPGVPRVGPTALALLALRNGRDRSEIREGLGWLARNYEGLRSPGSLAMASLCFKVYGRPAASLENKLEELYSNNQFLQNIPVIAWAALTLADVPCWLMNSSQAKGAK